MLRCEASGCKDVKAYGSNYCFEHYKEWINNGGKLPLGALEHDAKDKDEKDFIAAFRQWFIEYPMDIQDEEYNNRILSMPLMELFERHQRNWNNNKPGGSARAINYLAALCHQRSKDAGWWTDQTTGETYNVHTTPFCFGAKVSLIHSELSEALEGHRKGLMDDKLPHRKMAEVELADALIRIFDLAGACGMDLGGAVMEKLEYNRTREDHKVENRVKEGGKKY